MIVEFAIPVTNIAKLLEYVLLPYNDDVTKPRAPNTFLDGFAELGIDKDLIKNKNLLTDLIEKEKKATEITKILSRTRAMYKVHRIERKRAKSFCEWQ